MQSWITERRHRLWLLLLLLSGSAQAHVKWFAKVDPAEAPRPIGNMLTELFFVQMLLLSLLAIYVFLLVDRLALRKGVFATLDSRMKRSTPHGSE